MLTPGQTLGDYDILGEIGQGGMAVVYRARQRTLQREVALKVMQPEWANDPETAYLLLNEGQLLARCAHPNIVTIHDARQDNGLLYLVMAFLPGGTLNQHFKQSGALTSAHIARLVSQIAAGLDYLHQQGFLHLDLKPANILFTATGEACLSDFGIARKIGSLHPTRKLGTPAYMAPEQWHEQDSLNERTDVYALGILLYQMVCGRLPFVAQDETAWPDLHCRQAVTFPLDVPLPIQAVIQAALAKRPANRPHSAGALAHQFAQVLAASDMPLVAVASAEKLGPGWVCGKCGQPLTGRLATDPCPMCEAHQPTSRNTLSRLQL